MGTKWHVRESVTPGNYGWLGVHVTDMRGLWFLVLTATHLMHTVLASTRYAESHIISGKTCENRKNTEAQSGLEITTLTCPHQVAVGLPDRQEALLWILDDFMQNSHALSL